nr:MAG TPA: hypothetical protein [Caudoviricetes sp.]
MYNSGQAVHGAGHLVLVKDGIAHLHHFSNIIR